MLKTITKNKSWQYLCIKFFAPPCCLYNILRQYISSHITCKENLIVGVGFTKKMEKECTYTFQAHVCVRYKFVYVAQLQHISVLQDSQKT